MVAARSDGRWSAWLAGVADVINAFAARRGWLVLWGLQPDGLTSFNRLVGVEHLLRPMVLEKVTIADASGILHGMTNSDVASDFSPAHTGRCGKSGWSPMFPACRRRI